MTRARGLSGDEGDDGGVHRMADVTIWTGGYHPLAALGLDADRRRQIRVFPECEEEQPKRTQQQKCPDDPQQAGDP